MQIHRTRGQYSRTEPSEYSHTKCREPAAFFANRFQVACAAAASSTASSAIVGMGLSPPVPLCESYEVSHKRAHLVRRMKQLRAERDSGAAVPLQHRAKSP